MTRDFKGAAAETQLLTGVSGTSDLSFTVATGGGAGYPTGSGGDFVVKIGNEKVLCSARTSDAFTVKAAGRGYDDTTAVAHTPGEAVEHVLDAVHLKTVHDHVTDTARDDHTQYLNTTRHDLTARHAFGSALGTPSAAADVGTVAAAGSGTVPSRSDHVHRLGAGSIDSTTLFASNVIQQAAMTDNSVGNAELIDGAVSTAKVADSAIDEDKLNASVIGNGLTGAAGTPIAVGAGVGLDVSSGVVDVDPTELFVRVVVTDTVSQTIAGSDEILGEWSVTKPSGWGTYDLELHGLVDISTTDTQLTTAVAKAELYLAQSASDISIQHTFVNFQDTGAGALTKRQTGAVIGYVAGLTGDITLRLYGQIVTGAAADLTYEKSAILVKKHRVT